jgi:hypothetical protein
MSLLLASIDIKRTVAEWFNSGTVTGGRLGVMFGEWMKSCVGLCSSIWWSWTSCGVFGKLGIGIVVVRGSDFDDAGLCGAVVIMGDGERHVKKAVGEVESATKMGLLGAEAIGIGELEGGLVTRVLDRRLKTCGTSRGRNTGWFASIFASTTYKSNFESGK